jgi:hypothetical protein
MPVTAQVLFSETFDSQASAKVAANLTQGSAMEVRYLDYSSFTVGATAFGIPEAPGSALYGGAARSGVLMRSTGSTTFRIANLLAASSPGGAPLSFSGDYRLKFDMWLSLDPATTTTNSATTEVGIWGIGASNVQPLGRNFRSSAAGTWGWLSSDGGFSGTLNNGDAAFRTNGSQVVVLENPTQAGYWQQAWPNNPDILAGTGSTVVVENAPWNSWTTVEVTTIGGDVTVKFNGVEFFNSAAYADSFPTSGFAVIGYEDPFTTSSSWKPDSSWGLFDNFVIEAIPEPGSGSLMLLGAAMLMLRRRR